MEKLQQKNNICEVCLNKLGSKVLDLGNHPLCDDLKPINSLEVCEEYPIEILFCPTCYTAHQVHQPPKHKLFSPNYHYRAKRTGSVIAGMADLVYECEKAYGNLAGKTVIDIGCNDGSLLDIFREKGCKTLGIEPTDAALDADHMTINAFFDRRSAKEAINLCGYPDIITFTNVFAHIENLSELLDNVKVLMNDETKLVIENHYLGAIIDYGQFDTFYHEHPRTYSACSFKFIAERLNRRLTNVQFVSRYGGNIRAFIEKSGKVCRLPDETDFPYRIQGLQRHADDWCQETKQLIDRLVKEYGALPAKAFPGRAAILIKMLELSTNEISAVYEIEGSIKVHNYVPGTKIPILPEASLYAQDKIKMPIINLAWHLAKEVRENLRKNECFNDVIDIKSFKYRS